MELLSAARDLVVSGAAIFTALKAADGLTLWRQKLRGQTDFDVAREILERLIVVKKTFWTTRSPLVQAHEFGEGYRDLPADDPQYWPTLLEGNRRAFGARWEKLRDAWVELEGHSVKAEALWGATVDDRVHSLRACIHRVNVAMSAFLDDIANRGEHFQDNREYGRSVRADLQGRYDPGGNYEGGSLSADFQAAYESFEQLCREKLEA